MSEKRIEYPVEYGSLDFKDRARFHFDDGGWIEVTHTGTELYVNGLHRLVVEPEVANAIRVKLKP